MFTWFQTRRQKCKKFTSRRQMTEMDANWCKYLPKIRCCIYILLNFGNTLTFNNLQFWAMPGFIFSTDQSVMTMSLIFKTKYMPVPILIKVLVLKWTILSYNIFSKENNPLLRQAKFKFGCFWFFWGYISIYNMTVAILKFLQIS